MDRFLWRVWTVLLFACFFAEPERLLVGKREAAIMLSVSVRTVSNLLRMKSLASRRIGRRSLITMQSLRAFIRQDHPESPAPHSRAHTARNSEAR